jgi:hypothetical protein
MEDMTKNTLWNAKEKMVQTNIHIGIPKKGGCDKIYVLVRQRKDWLIKYAQLCANDKKV